MKLLQQQADLMMAWDRIEHESEVAKAEPKEQSQGATVRDINSKLDDDLPF